MNRALPLLGITLVTGGLFLLGILAWAIWNPSPPPFSYRMVAQGKADKFPELKLDEKTDFNIQKYDVRVSGVDKPVADFHVAYKNQADPVLLEWRNHLAEPVLTVSSTMSETKALAKAINKHAPEGSLILGWWDTSRRLQLLSLKNVLFSKNLAKPVLIPTMWENKRKSIEAVERDFWKVSTVTSDTAQFDKFTGALLSEPGEGVAKLKELAAGNDVFIVVHITDAYRLGALAPERFAIGYKDFASAAKIHGMVKYVKDWVKGQNHKAYTVLPLNDEVRRVFFLTDTASTKSLIAQMLPFNTSNPFEMDDVRLVFTHGGYWVYKLAGAKDKTANK